MSKRIRGSLFALLALVFCVFFAAMPHTEMAEAATQSRGECVLEVSSRRFLFENNAGARLPMASTTKVLTAIIILDDCNLDEEVEIPKAAEGTEGSSVYLRAGDLYTVRDLLYGLMLRSGNDCAVTLALHHSGSIDRFADAMNAKAVSLGAEDSHFTNPHGLPDENHYTTARDLALISAYAMENDTFREIVSCKFYEPRGWQNKNKMLFEYEGAIGVKTGYTIRAGRCLVTSAEREGMRLVCVVLDSPEMYERTAQLLDDAFIKYDLIKLCDKSQPFEGYRIYEDFFYPLTDAEKDKITIQAISILPFPVEAGQFAGQMLIYLENDLIFSQNLYIM